MSRARLIIDHEHEAAHERMLLNELIFWGCHTFREGWYTMSCTLCGWGYHEVVHNGKIHDPANDGW